jgi:hypothetical protein
MFPAGSDQVSTIVDLFFEPSQVPPGPTVRNFGPAAGSIGESKYKLNRYLQERGDPNIQNVTDLINNSNFYVDDWADTRFRDVKSSLENMDSELTFDMRERMFDRFAIQQIVIQCMMTLGLDALAYPTGNIPPAIPAGFTTHVYDRVRDADAPDGTRLVGPVPAVLPVGIDFLGLPFDEPTVIKIASVYEAATNHRRPPAAFGPLPR